MDDPHDLICLCYVSTARQDFGPDELIRLMAGSVARNAASGITGVLCVSDRSIMQFLEGDAAAVQALYQAIERDRRHGGCLVLLRRPITCRAFPHWSMALRDVGSLAPDARGLFADIRAVALSHGGDDGYRRRLETLLDSFLLCVGEM